MRALLLACLSALPAAPALAQTVVWSEGFENGLTGWTIGPDTPICFWGHGASPCTGTWLQVDAADPCAGWALPFPEGGHCARFGYPGQCTYEPGDGSEPDCSMITAAPIALPAGAGSIALRFWTQSEGEDDASYDQRRVSLSADGGSTWVGLGLVWNSSWYRQTYELTPWAGQNVLLKFRFDATDIALNDYRGWFLDDIVIETSTATGVAFCAGDGTAANCPCGNFGGAGRGCATSFEPQGALLSASGSPHVAGGSVHLDAAGVSNSVVTFFQGTAQQAFGEGVVFGDGLRCAGGTTRRLRSVLASGNAASVPGPGDPPLSTLGLVPPSGGVRTYQVWYRNAASFCTASTFNLSNGWIVHWQP
jgi:hypothetical protein